MNNDRLTAEAFGNATKNEYSLIREPGRIIPQVVGDLPVSRTAPKNIRDIRYVFSIPAFNIQNLCNVQHFKFNRSLSFH